MNIGKFEIGYLSDTARDYSAALDKAKSLAMLRVVVKRYDPFVWMDAPSIVDWNNDTFDAFKKFLERERKAKGGKSKNSEADMAKFSPIVLPMPMFDICIIASKFFAPFGVALIRGVEAGRYKIENDRIVIVEKDE